MLNGTKIFFKISSTIKNIVEEKTTISGKVFDALIQILIMLSLILFSIETLPNLEDKTRDFLKMIEKITVIVFTAEYLLRVLFSRKKLLFVFSFFGLIDLIAILPFYISTGIDLRGIRVFRFIKIFRVLKVLRYNRAICRFKKAISIVWTELTLFLGITFFITFISATGIYYFENPAQPEKFASVFHSLWWATATLTTVGYGDIYPITIGGKIFTFFILISSMGVIAIPTGLISSALTKTLDAESEDNT